jgi:hypothetical protein
MTRCRTLKALAGLALSLVLGLACAAPTAAPAPGDPQLSKEDQACLECHAKAGLRMTLGDGKAMSLYVAPQPFLASKHLNDGCEGCHSQIDSKTHGKGSTEVKSQRAFALEQMETCRDCHKKTMKQFDDSVHWKMVQGGSEKAPLCSDCHDPHATKSAKSSPEGETGAVQCAQCHKGVNEAFAGGVHANAGDEALECKDCHKTHDIKAASSGTHLRAQCNSCHKEVADTHAKWLPNSARHLEAIACAACHTPGATRRVDLRIHEGVPGQKSAEKVGVPQFVNAAYTAGQAGLDGRALWSLLQDLNRGNGADASRIFVRGRLEVQTGAQAHGMVKGQALKDCATCHRQGGSAFQAVTISMVGPDGRAVRHDASQGILGSLESLGAIGGFYAIGSTRIVLLDVLLLMALGAGIAIPGAHLVLRTVMARKRRNADKEVS